MQLNNYYEQRLFCFINPNDNDCLSKLNKNDLKELIKYLNHYKLSLKDRVGINSNNTFGFELEFEHVKKIKLYDAWYASDYSDNYQYIEDGTLCDGKEITTPMLNDNNKTWQDLNNVCNLIKKYGSIGKNSGGHIHIGAHSFKYKKEELLNLIYLWSSFENIIFRFSYGEYLSNRPSLTSYAKPIAYQYYKTYEEYKNSKYTTIDDLLKRLKYSKNLALNFKHVTNFQEKKDMNTIEVRCPNESLNAIIKQNELLFFYSLFNYAKVDNFDFDLVKKINKDNFEIFNDLSYYNKVYLNQALKLADLIYNNNLDKIYFLTQYLKHFQISDKLLVKSKRFTI